MSKILITGGLGFIGAFLAKHLLAQNHDVVLLDLEDSSTEIPLDGATVVRGNLLQDGILDQLPTDFDHIIHTAGILGIKKVSQQPLLTADVNVFATRKVLDFSLKQKDLKRFIHFSTSEVYGKKADKVEESDPSIIPNCGTRWIYASSKHFSEYLLKAFMAEHNTPGVIIRPFNVYGPYRKGSNAMTTLIKKALTDEEITITGTGEQTRCWCYIEDFIRGVLATLECDTAVGEAFNLGNSQESISMHELANRICHVTDSKSTVRILHNEDDDVLERSPVVEKAQRILSYQPTTTLDQGIREVADWLSTTLAVR